jgi:CRISPR-associated protein Cas4
MFYASPFKLSMFLECPRRYKFQYIDGLAEQFKVPKPHFTMGENVHEALREFFEKTEPGERTKEKLEETLRKIWRKNREGFKDKNEEKKFGLEAIEMLKLFIKKQDIKKKPLELEKMHKIPIDKDIILQGKIDRIDQEGDKIRIIDYKTGSEPQEQDLLQLIIYSIIVSQKLNKEIDKAAYLYLKSGHEKSIKPSKADLDNGILEIKSIVDMIKKEEDFEPNINKFCSWCEYFSICPMKEEIEGNKGNFSQESPF